MKSRKKLFQRRRQRSHALPPNTPLGCVEIRPANDGDAFILAVRALGKLFALNTKHPQDRKSHYALALVRLDEPEEPA